MSEVVSDIPMPSDSFFGKQMTVETALFRDVWNIVGDQLLVEDFQKDHKRDEILSKSYQRQKRYWKQKWIYFTI